MHNGKLLDGKVAIVTGVGPGMGRSISLRFAEHGADVVLAARSKDRLESVAEEVRAVGSDPLVVPTDTMGAYSASKAALASLAPPGSAPTSTSPSCSRGG